MTIIQNALDEAFEAVAGAIKEDRARITANEGNTVFVDNATIVQDPSSKQISVNQIPLGALGAAPAGTVVANTTASNGSLALVTTQSFAQALTSYLQEKLSNPPSDAIESITYTSASQTISYTKSSGATGQFVLDVSSGGGGAVSGFDDYVGVKIFNEADITHVVFVKGNVVATVKLVSIAFDGNVSNISGGDYDSGQNLTIFAIDESDWSDRDTMLVLTSDTQTVGQPFTGQILKVVEAGPPPDGSSDLLDARALTAAELAAYGYQELQVGEYLVLEADAPTWAWGPSEIAGLTAGFRKLVLSKTGTMNAEAAYVLTEVHSGRVWDGGLFDNAGTPEIWWQERLKQVEVTSWVGADLAQLVPFGQSQFFHAGNITGGPGYEVWGAIRHTENSTLVIDAHEQTDPGTRAWHGIVGTVSTGTPSWRLTTGHISETGEYDLNNPSAWPVGAEILFANGLYGFVYVATEGHAGGSTAAAWEQTVIASGVTEIVSSEGSVQFVNSLGFADRRWRVGDSILIPGFFEARAQVYVDTSGKVALRIYCGAETSAINVRLYLVYKK